jgi:hypothetical protein
MLGQIGCFDQLSIRFRTDVDPKIVEFEENPNFSGQAVQYTNTLGHD